MSLPKLSKYIFFAFLFLLPFQTVLLLREPMIGGEKWQYGTIGLYGTDILLILSVFFAFLSSVIPAKAGIQKDNSGSRVKPRMTTLSLMALVLWAGLSILWSPDQMLAGYFFMKLLLGAGVFFLARSLDESDMKTALKVLLAAAVIQGVIGIGQFVFQESVSLSLLGMSAHESWTAGTSVLKLEEGRFLRAYGSFPHPNILGGFLAVTLILSISYLVSGVADRQTAAKNVIPSVAEGSQQKKSKIPRFADSLGMTIKRSVLIVGLLIILFTLILTFSRAAWLGAALGVAFLAIYFFHKEKSTGDIISRPWNYVTALKVLWVIGMAVVVFVFVLRDQIFPRFDMATIEREGSVSERMVSLADAKVLIAEHPITGVGAGNFTKAVMENEPARPAWSVQPAHNVFVLVWAELGVVGLVLFLIFLVTLLKDVILGLDPGIQKILWSLDSRLRGNDKEDGSMLKNKKVIFAIAFLVLLPSLFLDHWLWSSHFGLLFFFLLAGFVAREH